MKSNSTTRRTATAALLVAGLILGCSDDRPEALVNSAKSYLANGDTSAAVIQLKNALQKNPDLAEARFLLGNSLLRSGDAAAAEKELRRALELGYAAEQVVPPLAQATLLIGEPNKVINDFGATQISSPEGRAVLQTAIGEAQLFLSQREAAKAAFDAALVAKADYAPALLGQAQIKASQGDLPGALASVDKATTIAPSAPGGWQLKGAILVAQGQQDAAITAYGKAIEVSPAYVPAHVAIASLLTQRGKLEDAKKSLEALQKIAPTHPQTLHLQALIAYHERNYSAARTAIQQELRILPDNPTTLALSGAIELELNSYAVAEANLRKVLTIAPDELPVRRLLIATYLRSGQKSKAMDTLKPVEDKIGDDSDMLAVAGEVYILNGNSRDAARFFEKAAALDPKNARKSTAVAITHLATGDTDRGFRELESAAATDAGGRTDLALIAANIRRGDMDKALVAIKALEKKQPNTPLPLNLQGGALAAKHDVAGARKSYESALAVDPAYFPAALNLAKLDLSENKSEDAKKRFDSILEKDPKNVQALLALADLRARSGAPSDEVAVLIARAIAAKPNEVAPRLAQINFHLLNKEPKKAVTSAREALAAIPDRPEFLDALGIAQNMAGEPDQALQTYRTLARQQPNSPLPYVRMAALQEAAKDQAGAMESLQKALSITPDLLEAQRGIAGIYLKQGKLQDALAVAKTVQKQRSKESVGYLLEGDIRAVTKEWREAVSAYQIAARQGDNVAALRLHAALKANQQLTEADKFALTWVNDHPSDDAFRLYLAEAAIASKEYSKAYAHLQAVLAHRADNALVLNNAAWVGAHLSDPKALGYAERAYALAPNSPSILDTYGVQLVDKGETARGLDLIEKAAKLAPDNGAIRLSLAKALIKIGKKDAAKRELESLSQKGESIPERGEIIELMKGL